jgi:hypothetical protein
VPRIGLADDSIPLRDQLFAGKAMARESGLGESAKMLVESFHSSSLASLLK